MLSGAAATAFAFASGGSKVVRYHGLKILVPSAWPVYDLEANPSVCVRFDRHAVYVGRPSSQQRCPAHAAGRTESILVEPATGQAHALVAAASDLPQATNPDAQRGIGSSLVLAIPANRAVVTATWNRHSAIIERALGIRSLASSAAHQTGRASPASTSS
ncbi:MAG: hypothetical protein M3018_09520, partial [Actinomycetota bacterium]|nr:hypothetical protein [Actinomycetota bacterium]